MTKLLKGLCLLALCAALLLTVTLSTRAISLARSIRMQSKMLEESRTRWEQMAAEKETLQARLKEVRSALREAELTLEESTVRAEELRLDIQELETQYELLISLNQSK